MRVYRRCFTLMELLVVMGVLAVLSAITVMAYRAVAKDAKLASAKNALTAVLDNARGLAMRENDIVLVAFRPRLEGRTQYVEAVLAKWSRQSVRYTVSGSGTQIADRFVPIAGIAPRRLPTGIQIAAPAYGGLANASCENCNFTGSFDGIWLTLSHLPNIRDNTQGERPGCIVGVMFAPNGRAIMQNARSDAQRVWVDFNNDHEQQLYGPLGTPIVYDPLSPPNFVNCPEYADMFSQYAGADEPFVIIAPYLAVFDDEDMRELNDPTRWNMLITDPGEAMCNRVADYTEYINANADRIHFNRYTGVAMK